MGNSHGMTTPARRGLLLLLVAAAVAGCPRPAPPQAPAPASAAPSPLASVSRSPSPSPPRPSPRPSPSLDPTVQRQLFFKGTSPFALEGPFRLVAGERTFRCYYDGRGALNVILYRGDGQADTELFNRVGPFSDAATYTVKEPGAFRLQVTGASGPWRIEVR